MIIDFKTSQSNFVLLLCHVSHLQAFDVRHCMNPHAKKVVNYSDVLALSQTSSGLYVSAVLAISPFPAASPNVLDNFQPGLSNFKLSSANSFSLEECEIYYFGKG